MDTYRKSPHTVGGLCIGKKKKKKELKVIGEFKHFLLTVIVAYKPHIYNAYYLSQDVSLHCSILVVISIKTAHFTTATKSEEQKSQGWHQRYTETFFAAI